MSTSGEPMNGVDTAWLRMDRPTNLMVITAMAVTEKLTFSAFRDRIRDRFLAFDRFQRKPVQRSGLYYWERDDHFDLSAHVRQAALPGQAGRMELQQFVSDLLSTPLDYNKPLWQFHFIENYGDQCAVVMRIHHCYADGLSLMSVFGALTDEDAAQRSLPPQSEATPSAANDESIPEANPSPGDVYQQLMEAALKSVEKYARLSLKMSEDSIHMLHEPSSLMALGRLVLSAAGEVSRLAALPSDPKTIVKGNLGVGKSCVWSEPLPLARFKKLSHHLGCSVNDLLLSCVAGVLRRYLAQTQVDLAELELHATVPVNIQLSNDAADMDEARSGGREIGNQFGTVFVALPVGIERPVERVYRIKHEMQMLRRSLQPGISYGIMAALGLMPGRLQSQVLDLFSSKSSLVLSNVPGTQQPRYLAGAAVREVVYWVPQSGDIALGVSLLSYQGQIQIGLVADNQVIGEPQRLIDAFVTELEYHEAIILGEQHARSAEPVPISRTMPDSMAEGNCYAHPKQ